MLARLRRRSELDRVIAPEIKDDAFYESIIRVASMPGLSHILEIGASSGTGSTEAFVAGIGMQPEAPTLHSLEVSEPRYRALVERYRDIPFVRCYHASSVALSDFPSVDEVASAWRAGDPPLRTQLRWLRQDIDYITEHDVPQSAIDSIKEEFAIDSFDVVLIDGSEFTGTAELAQVYGARFLLLDDIRTFKNRANYERLSDDPGYRLMASDPHLRHGFAVFCRASEPI